MIFRSDLAKAILRGEKTATRRIKSDKPGSPWYRERCSYEVGQRFTINPGRGVKNVGIAKVTDVYSERLGDMDEDDARAEGFRTLVEFKNTWNALGRDWLPDESVWVIEFEQVEEGNDV